MNKYDLVVIGSGPGGYVAAIRSAQRGLKTALIEKEHIGGVCLNWGCIPTKAIIKSVNTFRDIQTAASLGIELGEAKADVKKIVARSRQVADQLSKGISFLLKKNKVDIYDGFGKLLDANTIQVEKNDGEVICIETADVILATGAKPKALPHIQPDGKKILTSKHALALDELPEKMAIMGAGAIGLEFAYIYKHLGVELTIIEALDAIAPNEDAEISKELLKQYKKQKIKSLVSTKVMKVEDNGDGLKLILEGPKGESELEVDMLLSAVGVTPNTQGLGLEELGIEMDGQFIKVNDKQETNVKHVYAIGDVAGNPCLAHKASKEGLIAIDNIQAKSVEALKKDAIPACTYCEPQVASIGLSEEVAVERGLDYHISKVFYRAIGKAIAVGHVDGFMKFVVEKESGKILGAHCIGAEATELIAELSLAVTKGMTVKDVAETIHAHPTLSEITMETAENALGEAIHV
ncbi:MAG: dihydrolipoyl dehydrogenase [Candidatus Neomarinimicrobiota bacterium]